MRIVRAVALTLSARPRRQDERPSAAGQPETERGPRIVDGGYINGRYSPPSRLPPTLESAGHIPDNMPP
jgi:hypothetical protein